MPAPVAWRKAVADADGGTRPLTIVCIGDSNTEMPHYPGALRKIFQSSFGNRGIGYVSFGPREKIPGQPEMASQGKWTQYRIADDPKKPKPPTPWFALDGMWRETEDPQASLTVNNAAPAIVNLLYVTGPDLGSFTIISGNKQVKAIDAKSKKPGCASFKFETAAAFEIARIKGKVILLGADIQTRGTPAGAVLHQLGAGWGTTNDFVPIEQDGFNVFMQSARPGLVVVGLGTNDMNNVGDADLYRKNLIALTDKIHQAAPDAIILLFACAEAKWTPGSNGVKYAQIVKDLATSKGFLVLDIHAMAGSGGQDWMAGKFLQGDNLHYSAEGGKLIADGIVKLLRFDPANHTPRTHRP